MWVFKNKDIISEYLKNSAFCDNVMNAYIDLIAILQDIDINGDENGKNNLWIYQRKIRTIY